MAVLKENNDLKHKLIKISRKNTGFFTDIFVYDKDKCEPEKFDVLRKGTTSEYDGYISCNVVFFKDLETKELLMFSVSEDSELLSENIKSKNNYLIDQMKDFVRIKYDIFNDYYKGIFDIFDVEDLLKLEFPPVPKSQKFLQYNFYRNEESYEYDELVNNCITNSQRIEVSSKMFHSILSKCLLWSKQTVAVEYWLDLMETGLYNLLSTSAKDDNIKLIDLFFYKKNDIESDLKTQCEDTLVKIRDFNYTAYEYLVRPEIIDYKQAKERYDNFIVEVYKIFVNRKNDLIDYKYEVYKEIKDILRKIISKLIGLEE